MKKLTNEAIRNICDARERLSDPDRAAAWRMSSLVQTINSPVRHSNEVLRYFPIATVATIEGYFRSRLADLVDSGEPFISNAVAAYPNVQLDAALARAIATKTVSLGDLIMYSVSISSLQSLVQVVTKITGKQNFIDELCKISQSICSQARTTE